MKVLLINLPVPDFYHGFQKGNHQIFAGYMRAIMEKRKSGDVVIGGLDRHAIDNYNDNALVECIMEQSPDVVGFSSYLWNVERNSEISRQLRKNGIITVTGGPEINRDNVSLLDGGAFDIFVQGEGESVLPDVLEDIAAKKHKKYYAGEACDFNKFISGYSGATDDTAFDRMAYIEIERGCPFKCSFCAYDKTRKSSTVIDMDAFKNAVDGCFSRDIDELYLLAPTLNSNRKRFESYLEYIAGKRSETGKNVRLFGELRPELIAGGDIGLMKEAGFDCIEFGVQSMNLEYKKNLAKYDLSGFAKNLLAHGITPIIDFIVGFPGETKDDVIRTIDYMSDNAILDYCNFYHLQVLHNTGIRKVFIEKGYSFQDCPPYLMLENDVMDIGDIKDIYMYLEDRKDFSYREDYLVLDENRFHVIRNNDDFNSLSETPFYHSASFVLVDNFDFDVIVRFYDGFFGGNPEIFHQVYLYSRQGFEMNDLEALSGMMTTHGNYYDRYREGINYFNDEIFSKTIHVLSGPDSDEKMIGQLMDNYDFGFAVLPGERNSFADRIQKLRRYFLDDEINTFVFRECDDMEFEFIKRFPVYFGG
jgi:hypothetical protein